MKEKKSTTLSFVSNGKLVFHLQFFPAVSWFRHTVALPELGNHCLCSHESIWSRTCHQLDMQIHVKLIWSGMTLINWNLSKIIPKNRRLVLSNTIDVFSLDVS